MKILQLCLRVPYPPNDGGNIAMYNMATALAYEGCEVHIAALNTSRHFVNIDLLPADYIRQFHFRSVNIDTKVKVTGAVANLFSRSSYNVTRFISADFRKLLVDLLKKHQFDVVQFESLFMAPYIHTIRQYSNATCILRMHNVETMVWRRLLKGETSLLKKIYLRLLVLKLGRYEKHIVKEFDGIVAFTNEDIKVLRDMGCDVATQKIPISIDTSKYFTDINTTPPIKLYHLGGMDWLPNMEAVEWWLKNVFPLLQKELPTVEMHIAGIHMPQKIFAMADNKTLFVYGKVDNVKEFMADKHILVVPLLSGGGMRVKILEGLAAAKVVISTTIGAEGIEAIPEQEILIADTPDEFVAQLKKVTQNIPLLTSIAQAGHNKALALYDYRSAGKSVMQFYTTLNKKR